MTDLTDYAEGQFIDWSFLGNAVDSAPGNIYIALHTGDPNDDGTASTEPGNQNEVSAGDYSRASVSTGTTNWSKNTSGQQATIVSNDNEIAFGTASSSWGTISHFSIWTSASGGGGNPIWASALDNSKTIEANDEIRFDAGSLTAEMD